MVWIPQAIVTACSLEATRVFPLETGGVFMGYQEGTQTVVITHMIGPGPHATHGLHHFEPDAHWQWQQIATHYDLTGRRETYVGDWHTHPRAQHGNLSWTDRKAVTTIAAAPSSRCPAPVMCVFWGQPGEWQATGWIGRLRHTMFLDRLDLRLADVQVLTGHFG